MQYLSKIEIVDAWTVAFQYILSYFYFIKNNNYISFLKLAPLYCMIIVKISFFFKDVFLKKLQKYRNTTDNNSG